MQCSNFQCDTACCSIDGICQIDNCIHYPLCPNGCVLNGLCSDTCFVGYIIKIVFILIIIGILIHAKKSEYKAPEDQQNYSS
ncbi:hypothetical protein pb186bvf_009457 [Paramecium bursaria]